jgi:hypothetical protein
MNFQTFKENLKRIFPAKLLDDEVNLKVLAELSEEDVIRIAQEYIGIDKFYTENTSRNISLALEDDKLVWHVRFAPTSKDGLPVKGGHTILVISDKTKRVIQVFNSPY